MRGVGHEPVAGGDEEQQREAHQLEEEQQREALRVLASRAGCETGAVTTKKAAAGGCDRLFRKQASVEARLHGAGCRAAIAVATTNETAAGACDGPVPKQAAAAADAGALAETSTRTAKDKWRPKRGKNAAFTMNTKRLTGGPWEGNTQALTRTTEDKWRPKEGENAAFNHSS